MRFLDIIKKWLVELTEVALLLIALGIAIEILFGGGTAQVPFFGTIVKNITGLIADLGETGLAGLAALGIVVYLFRKKATA